jgi:O-antigen/teichoic acid export membrane protein
MSGNRKTVINKLKSKWKRLFSDKRFSEVLTGSIWSFGAKLISTFFAMTISIVIARIYGSEIIGIVAIVQSLLGLTTIFTVLGTHNAILRLIPEHIIKYSASSAFGVYRKTQHLVIGVSLATGGLLFWLSDIVAEKVFSKPQLSFLIALSSIFVVFLSLMTLNTHAVRGLRLIRAFSFLQMLPAVSQLLILIGITLYLFDRYNPVYALFTSFIVTAAVGALIVNFEFKNKMKKGDYLKAMPINEILAISIPMLMTTTMSFVIGQTGVLMLGMFRTETEVGYYAIAVKLATLTTFVLAAINSMAAPKFSELFHSGNMDDLIYVARKSTQLIFWTTVPILIGLVVFGKPVLKLLFGPEYTASYYAMVLLVIGQFGNSISGSTGYFMNMTGSHKAFRNIILLTAIITIGLGFAFIPSYGIIGAAFAGMCSILFWNIRTLIYIKLKYDSTIAYLPILTK